MIRRTFKRLPYQTHLALILGAAYFGLIALQGCSQLPVTATHTVCLPMRDYTGTTIVQGAATEIDQATGQGIVMDDQKVLNRDYHVMRNLNSLACKASQNKENSK